MPAARIVEPFDDCEHRTLGLGVRLERVAVEQLAFQRRKETLGKRVEAPIFVKPVLVRFLVRRGG